MAPSGLSSGGEEEAPRPGRKSTKKLQKKRPTDEPATMEMPERLRRRDDDEEDLTVAASQGPTMFDMNQSIWGMIAAAGSRVDFNERLEPSSEDEDEGEDDETLPTAQTTILKGKSAKARHRGKLSGHKLLRSLPALPRLSKKKDREASKISLAPTIEAPGEESDGHLSQEEESTTEEERLAPVMSRMLQAREEMASRPSFDLERVSGESSRDASESETGPSKLAKKLKDIFEFDKPEEVIVGAFLQRQAPRKEYPN
jgi:sterol 3beta-glucosyltransferase